MEFKPRFFFPGAEVMEIPINTLLDYQYSSYACFMKVRLYMNKYSYNQRKPEIRVLRSICLVNPSEVFQDAILSALNRTILENLKGCNLGMHHLPVESIWKFYQERSQTARAKGLASHQFLNAVEKEMKSDGTQVLRLPELHQMAS